MLEATGMMMVSRNGMGDSHMNNDSLLFVKTTWNHLSIRSPKPQTVLKQMNKVCLQRAH
jgi:hypothetical protein